MGAIISKEGTIDALQFRNIAKGKVVKADKVLRLDDRSVLMKLDNGAFTILGSGASLNGNMAILNFGVHEPSKSVLDGLVKIGAITGEAKRRHISRVKANTEKRAKEQAAYRLQELCEEIGVEMPDLPDGIEPKRHYW